MEAQVRLPNGIIVKVDGKSQKELFVEISSIHEVFGESKCGLCQSTNIKPVTRVAGDYDFPEFHCQDCFARLSFGQNQKGGGLFPIRKLNRDGKPDRENGTFGKHNGWTKYKGEPKKAK